MTQSLMAALLIACLAVTGGCVATPKVPDRPSKILVSEYSLTVRVFPDDRRIEVTGTVQVPAVDTPRAELRLSLSERMQGLEVEVAEPVASAGMAQLERSDESGVNRTWIVRPPHAFAPGKAIVLKFSYSGNGEIATHYYVGPEIAFASAWGSDWYPLMKGESDKSTGVLDISVPAGWSVATGGARLSTAGEEAHGTFRSAIPHETYFSFAAGNYTILRHEGAVPLSAYLLARRDHIDPYLTGVGAMLDVLTREFGAFPRDELALVEVPRELANGAGFNAVGAAGLLLLNSRTFDPPDTKYILEFLGHELGHQWFPHAVALRTPPGLYMEEALAEYGGLKVVEAIAGAEAARRLRTSGFEYDPMFSARAYFTMVGEGVDQPLAHLEPKLEHRNLAYNKGFLVFNMLAREIGQDEFRRALHEITRERAFQSMEWREFLDAIEAGAGRELDWFFEQWFERTGAPDFQLSWAQEGDVLRGAIIQAEPYYRAHVEVEVQGDDERRLVQIVETEGLRTEFTSSVGFHVQSVTLDPHYEVLRWTPEFRSTAASSRP